MTNPLENISQRQLITFVILFIVATILATFAFTCGTKEATAQPAQETLLETLLTLKFETETLTITDKDLSQYFFEMDASRDHRVVKWTVYNEFGELLAEGSR